MKICGNYIQELMADKWFSIILWRYIQIRVNYHRVNDIEDCISKIDIIILEINRSGFIILANNG